VNQTLKLKEVTYDWERIVANLKKCEGENCLKDSMIEQKLSTVHIDVIWTTQEFQKGHYGDQVIEGVFRVRRFTSKSGLKT
jgi:hypothetical protein